MIFNRAEWYTPEEVLVNLHTFGLKSLPPQKNEAKKVWREFNAGALMAMGLMKLYDECFMVQLPEDANQSPDVVLGRVLSSDSKGLNPTIPHDVEVVSQTKYSYPYLIDDFLRRTKLSPIFAYPLSTIFLCEIESSIDRRRWGEIHHILAGEGVRREIYLLRRLEHHAYKYQLARVTPHFDHQVSFNLQRDSKLFRQHVLLAS